MKLWTLELEKKAKQFPLGSQDGKGFDAEVLVKYFNPYGAGTWIATEAEKQDDGDILFFGYCHIFEWEWGSFTLSELENVNVNIFGFDLPIERDLHIPNGATVKDCVR